MVELIHVDFHPETIASRHERQRKAESLDARHKYLFAEDGFNKAKENAMEIARLRQITAAEDENDKVLSSDKPSAYSRAIDGVDNAPDSSFKL